MFQGKTVRYFLLFMIPWCAHAGESLNLTIPSAPGTYQQDTFRADGLECSMAIGSGTNVEFGVVGIINKDNASITTDPSNNNKDVGVYARMIIPIGAPKNRLNCDALYQLELQKKRMEIDRLQREVQNLKSLRFENTVR